MSIQLEEVLKLGERWFHTVANHGTAEEQASYFVTKHPYIYVVSSGVSIDMDKHEKLHSAFTNELHIYGDFTITQLSDDPERARATGTVYWEAAYLSDPKKVIKAAAGEDWIVERCPDGELKFVIYMNTFHHLLPNSAPLAL